MKGLLRFMLVAGLVLACLDVGSCVRAHYVFNRDIGSYWSLADKASTIEKKSGYIDKYVDALDRSGAMHGHNALIFQTPDNDLEQNMAVLTTLQQRLHEIKAMDVQSLTYQQAIQQITAQEQGEARELTETLEGGWMLHRYWYSWGWIPVAIFAFSALLVASGISGLSPKGRRGMRR